MGEAAGDARAPHRVRHALKRRVATVARVERLSRSMVRIHLAGDDLKDFASPGFDDHVKLFFPAPGQAEPILPTFGPNGPVFAEDAPRPIMRDYTPRLFDASAGTLAIDFALHENGPATSWARRAKPGDRLSIGGPRGSILLSTSFDGFVLIGDETALPAMTRRIGEIPHDKPVLAVIEVDGTDDLLPLPSHPRLQTVWVHRDGTGAARSLPSALEALAPPDGDLQIWVAAESSVAKAVRHVLLTRWGANPKWVKASAYWRRGDESVHEHLD